MSQTINQLRRNIPSVDKLLEVPAVLNLTAQTSRPFVLSLIRKVLSRFRQEIANGVEKGLHNLDVSEIVLRQIQLEYQQWTEPTLKKVINATGVLLHTNLGRAPLSRIAIERIREVTAGYSNLEFDLEQGTRGKRDVFADRWLREIVGCERALVVNNNAAALLLILNTLAENGEVLVSRGELIEIGDSFRIPDIMRKSGGILREVGTTNKTRLSDYADAITERTRLILRVHPSNFRIVGFTSRPSLEELLELCNKKSLPLLEDLGSGCLIDLKPFGIDDEPDPKTSLKAGVPLVCFSGDKLLGGPQAGIIAGRTRWIQPIRRNPLFRALRVDKLTLAVLESTLISYLKQREADEVPVARMIHESPHAIEERARSILSQLPMNSISLETKIIDGLSRIGGGSTPQHGIPTRIISLASSHMSLNTMESRLRKGTPPILARLDNDRLLLDLRTVFPEDDVHILAGLKRMLDVST